MNPIDDMFRDGLGGRKGEIPADMWSRVSAGKAPVAPEGEGVDQYFSEALKDRPGDVPADMWSRIAATGVPAAAGLDQVFADGLRDREGHVPSGMWDKIWKGRAAVPFFTSGRVLTGVAAILLLLSFGWWMLAGTQNEVQTSVENNTAVIAEGTSTSQLDESSGSAAGATMVEGAEVEEIVANKENRSAETEQPSTTQSENQSEAIVSNTPTVSLLPTFASDEQEKVAKTNSGLTLENSSEAEDENRTPQSASSPDEAVANDVVRSISGASPSLTSNSAIPALEVDVADLKIKRRYLPKTPSVNSFRAANRHRLQTEFLFGAFYANQQFSAETADQRAQRNIREVRENPGLSYQVSLRGAYKLNERLILRSGLTYSEIQNRFDYERIIDGTLTLVRTNNHIRQLEVPVLMGLRIPGRRLNVSLNAGPLVNLTTSVQGRFLHPDSTTPLSLATDGQYRSNVGVGFMTSLSTTYVIGKKQPFVLLVEPFFKAYPGSYTRKAAPLKEKYWAAGLQLGIRKGF